MMSGRLVRPFRVVASLTGKKSKHTQLAVDEYQSPFFQTAALVFGETKISAFPDEMDYIISRFEGLLELPSATNVCTVDHRTIPYNTIYVHIRDSHAHANKPAIEAREAKDPRVQQGN